MRQLGKEAWGRVPERCRRKREPQWVLERGWPDQIRTLGTTIWQLVQVGGKGGVGEQGDQTGGRGPMWVLAVGSEDTLPLSWVGSYALGDLPRPWNTGALLGSSFGRDF